MDKKIASINKVGTQVFYNPKPLLNYDTLIKKSLGPNTYRGFHKVDKNRPGSKHAFEKVLFDNSKFIIKNLRAAKTEKDLDNLEKEICKILKKELKKNIDTRQLNSFNKLRKPIDIVIEHLISMGNEFSSVRKTLTEHLYLPLDSQMFQSTFVFSDKEIAELKIKRSFTFKDIVDDKHYYEIQSFLKQKAVAIGVSNRIFFDLVWNERYKSKGKNLFATNS
jgi:hypothetical protein